MAEHVLVVLRHAKSDWSGDEPDRERPLAARGRRQAPEAGAWLAGNVAAPDLAVVSPAARARATWELVADQLPAPPELRVDERVYASGGHHLLEVVAGLPEQAGTVVLVGHNPSLEELVFLLTGRDVVLPTAAIAVIGLPGAWSAAGHGDADLRATGRPPGQ